MRVWAAGMVAVAMLVGMVPRAQAQSEKTVYGTLTNVDRDERYEQRCGILCHVFNGEAPRAYQATVTDSTGGRTTFWFFAPKGNTIPHLGELAYWHLHRGAVVRSWQCSSYGCPLDIDYMLTSDSDVFEVTPQAGQ